LHLQIQEQKQSSPESGSAAAGEDPGQVFALKQELAELRERLEQERIRLEEDEQAVQEQLRQMELSLSRERVELARQRSELQRLQSDFTHELEMAARDEKLRERLIPLQRRNQEVAGSKGAGSAPPRPASTGQLPRPTTMPQIGGPGASEPNPLSQRPTSGLLRRLFGKGE
jgi:hypothetical protein